MPTIDFAQGLLALIISATIIMGSPGPSNLSAAAMGVAFGVRKSMAYVAGLATGTISVLLLVSAGLIAFVTTLPYGTLILKTASAIYLAYLAWKIATAPALQQNLETAEAPAFAGGFLLGIANPKAYFAIGAVLAGTSMFPEAPALDAVAKIAVLIPLTVFYTLVWLLLGVALSTALKDPFVSRVANLAMALALVATSAVALAG